MTDLGDILGRGVYAPTEAARLIGLAAPKVNRWIGDEAKGAVWENAFRSLTGSREMSFLDLQQLRVVSELRRVGVSLQAIRKGLAAARDVIATSTPFAHHALKTDGRDVFMKVAEAEREPELIDLTRNQYAFEKVLAPVLRDVDFGADYARRWWPSGKSKRIVLDPERSFGRPIDAESGVPTRALALAADAEGSVRRAATLFEVPEAAVRQAVAFEQKLAA